MKAEAMANVLEDVLILQGFNVTHLDYTTLQVSDPRGCEEVHLITVREKRDNNDSGAVSESLSMVSPSVIETAEGLVTDLENHDRTHGTPQAASMLGTGWYEWQRR